MNATPVPRPSPLVRSWRGAQDHIDRVGHVDTAYTQGALALSYPLATGAEAEPAATALTLVRSAPPPDATSWAARFVQAVVEVISSDRPLSQLVRWTAEPVYAEIAGRKHQVMARRGTSTLLRVSRQHVATVHVSEPSLGAAEVAARIVSGGRSRALAARLEYVRGRWTCTAISFG